MAKPELEPTNPCSQVLHRSSANIELLILCGAEYSRECLSKPV